MDLMKVMGAAAPQATKVTLATPCLRHSESVGTFSKINELWLKPMRTYIEDRDGVYFSENHQLCGFHSDD